MEYKGYEIKECNGGIIVEGVKDFDPVHIFECGQCFRWTRQNDGSYNGVAMGRAVKMAYDNGRLEIHNSNIQDFIDIWFDYLDLGTDYSAIKDKLRKDEIMERAIAYGHGIRLLRQNLWETLISFIISANNRIPRIMRTVDIIAREYGQEVKMDGKSFYSFPSPDRLSEADIEELEICKGGFRCKYIHLASQAVKSGAIELDGLEKLNTDAAREELMKFSGVGPKVADCVLLFSGIKYDVFPTDVWVKRVMEELYFKREASFKEIREFAADYFGELAGFAQQYLFYYARENKIGAK